MSTAWDMLEALLSYPELADLLAERHRIVSNDWQCASMADLIARNLERAVAILGRVDFTTAALRADLTANRVVPRYIFSVSEMLNFAADLTARSAVLTHENERRWRIFHERVDQILGAADPRRQRNPTEGTGKDDDYADFTISLERQLAQIQDAGNRQKAVADMRKVLERYADGRDRLRQPVRNSGDLRLTELGAETESTVRWLQSRRT